MTSFTERLLWRRAGDWLQRYRPLVIGVAGSTLADTAVQAIAQAIGTDRLVYAPRFVQRTPLEVALAILGVERLTGKHWFRLLTGSLIREMAEREADVLVLEVGAWEPGFVDRVAQAAPFTVGVITDVGSQNLSLYRRKDLVAHELASLVTVIPRQEGMVVLNADDPLVLPMKERTQATVELIGKAREAAVRLVRVERLSSGGLACELLIHGRSHELHLPQVVGRHQVIAVLAAVAVAHMLQLDLSRVAARLQAFRPPAGRLTLSALPRGVKLLDDSFDATPESMRQALTTLKELPARRRIAVLGDVVELSGESQRVHHQLGLDAAAHADMLVVVGEEMRAAGAAALQAKIDVHQFEQAADVGKWLPGYLKDGDLVLVSGSRPMKLEELVARLVDKSR